MEFEFNNLIEAITKLNNKTKFINEEQIQLPLMSIVDLNKKEKKIDHLLNELLSDQKTNNLLEIKKTIQSLMKIYLLFGECIDSLYQLRKLTGTILVKYSELQNKSNLS